MCEADLEEKPGIGLECPGGSMPSYTHRTKKYVQGVGLISGFLACANETVVGGIVRVGIEMRQMPFEGYHNGGRITHVKVWG
ncbi:hypothetical protein AG1IA_04166 [Rhizoctonia solani AG-1 IA]|uniref:Uncharacterized protein n=1 Tax=Thanatephorus cucumeris (strain AG1-IA) TaxID=983506 RepID=L8WYC7_THACA|nr:hypothetical protein AG1IA_04166 [Rhizoctonia solani AG-1 IA]